MKVTLRLTREEAVRLLQAEDEGQTFAELAGAVEEQEKENYNCLGVEVESFSCEEEE